MPLKGLSRLDYNPPCFWKGLSFPCCRYLPDILFLRKCKVRDGKCDHDPSIDEGIRSCLSSLPHWPSQTSNWDSGQTESDLVSHGNIHLLNSGCWSLSGGIDQKWPPLSSWGEGSAPIRPCPPYGGQLHTAGHGEGDMALFSLLLATCSHPGDQPGSGSLTHPAEFGSWCKRGWRAELGVTKASCSPN